MSDQLALIGGGPRATGGATEYPLADAEPLRVWRRWFPDHGGLLDHLTRSLPWEQHRLQTPGGLVAAPRLECWMAEEAGRPYVYSGERYTSSRLSDPRLRVVRDEVERTTGARFDALFANLYRTGQDSIGWHADAETDALGPLPDIVIASLSLGARRTFKVRNQRTEELVTLELGEGDLLLMGYGVQANYVHSAPKTARPVGPRLNLTFRRLVRR